MKKLQIDPGFYKELEITDDTLLTNIEMAVELYQGHYDKKKTDATINFEKAVGILSMSYVKMVQQFIREDWKKLTPQRKLAMNFGILDARTVMSDHAFLTLIGELDKKHSGGRFEVFYLNEWFEKIARGVYPLTSDVAQTKAKSTNEEQRDRAQQKIDAIKKDLDRLYKAEFDEFQLLLNLFNELDVEGDASDKLKMLRSIRKTAASLEASIKEQAVKVSEMEVQQAKLSSEDETYESAVDARRADQMKRLRDEFEILMNVIRSCAVRGGILKNTPVLIDKWIPLDTRLTAFTKEHVEDRLNEFEQIDETIFTDKKGKRTPPKIVILPGVGTGMAWRDRIMMSLFAPPTTPPDISILRTLAGYRWYHATASFNWKDLPGELGSSFKHIHPDKSFNDLQKEFISNYVDWMTREAQGYQVLSADVRKLFWKKIPFPKELKEKLFKRATVYRQLYSKEIGGK